MINIMTISMHGCLLYYMQQSDRQSLCQPKLSVVLAVSFHDLHTWMTSSYMTYKTCYTLRLRHVSHPDTKGHGITGVHACNMHKHTHTYTHKVSSTNQNNTRLCMITKHNLPLYLPQISLPQDSSSELNEHLNGCSFT